MVHFVGAGPGAPDLITLRGAEYLKAADVVIYAGSLVNPRLLENCRGDCDVYNSARMNLDAIAVGIGSVQTHSLAVIHQNLVNFCTVHNLDTEVF